MSVFQAVTQIQEMTLTFIPKLVAILGVLGLFGHWMLMRLVGFTVTLLSQPGHLHALAMAELSR